MTGYSEQAALEAHVSHERMLYLKGRKRRRRLVRTAQIAILVLFFAQWEILARLGVIDSFILSQPSRILRTYANMAENNFFLHIGVTVFETLVGFLLGAALGTGLAVALWWNDFIAKVSEPYLVVLNSLPKIALGPVIIILVGAGTEAIIFMALAISMIVTVLEMLSGFRRTDGEYIKMAHLRREQGTDLFENRISIQHYDAVQLPQDQYRAFARRRDRRGIPRLEGGARLPHRLRGAGVQTRPCDGERARPVRRRGADVRGRRPARARGSRPLPPGEVICHSEARSADNRKVTRESRT